MPENELHGPTSHTFVSQRMRLHYVDWGNRDAPPLILLHGGRDHSRSWDWVAQELRRDWHVIAPDLRGHGDSAWSPDGSYSAASYLYDLAQLIHQEQLEPVTIVAHSLGGNVALRYTGLYPEKVRRLVVIEGLGFGPRVAPGDSAPPVQNRWHWWIDERRRLSARLPKRYASIEEALERMRTENQYLSEDQARHLTEHGASRNEDGTYSWKFDNYVRSGPPVDIGRRELTALWRSITCPVLLCWGRKSWATDPAEELERKERCGQIRHAISQLPEEYRAVLVLREMDGCCYETIADVLDLPVGTVRSRLHRARLQLREELKGMLAGEGIRD
jgi:RNA polymerase sigma factor (sigma-70 family)